MNLATELLGIGSAVPAALAGLLTWCGLRYVRSQRGQAWALPLLAAAVAFAASYALLPEWAALWPERHWQWLPWLALAAAVIGPAGIVAGRPTWARSLAMTAIAVGAAFLLVPTWPDLHPPRRISMAVIAIYLSALILAIEWLGPRMRAASLLALLAGGGAILAATLIPLVSVRFGILAAMAGAALAGSALAVRLSRDASALEVRGVAPLYAVLAGGTAYVGAIEPQPPLWWLLVIPAIPMVLGAIILQFKPYQASAGSGR